MATSATVFANPNYVCVPPGVKSVPSVVTYAAASSGPPVKVWVRQRAPVVSAWGYLRDPKNAAAPMNPLKGTATFDLTPGQIIDIELHPSDSSLDHNVSTFNLTPLASTAIFGLSGNPAVGEWGVDGPRLDIGGTFAIFYFYTIASVIGRVSVSTSNASKNACGFNSFPAGTVVGQGADGPTNLHQLKVEPLLPGTTYNYIIEMFDLSGNRIVKDGSFSTLRRKITGKISSIFIEDDGDNTGTGESNIGFKVIESLQPAPNQIPPADITSFSDYYDDIDTGKFILNIPSMTFSSGPEAGDFTLGFIAGGTEFDGFAEDDEIAQMTSPVYLATPTGQTSETVTNQTINIRPGGTTGSFMFNANVEYSIEYV